MQKWLCVFLLTLVVIAPGSLWADQWEELNPTVRPSPRYGHTMVELKGSVYLFGGLQASSARAGALNELWKYDFEDNIWAPVSTTNLPPARAHHSASVSSGKMYIFGGEDGAGKAFNDVWSYEPVANKWQQEPSTGSLIPTGMSHHSGTALPDGRIAVLGGLRANGSVQDDSLWLYSTANGSWEHKSGYRPRYGHQAVVFSNKLYVLPGAAYQGYDASVWVYDLSSSTWSTFTPQGEASPRKLYACAQQGDKLWIFGGSIEGYEFDDTWKFDFTTNTWTECAKLPIPMGDNSAVLRSQSRGDAQLLLFGGLSAGVPINRVFQYSSGNNPPVEKILLNQIGALSRGQFAMLFLHFPKIQDTVKVQMEWAQAKAKLRLCAFRLPHHAGFQDYMWEQFAFNHGWNLMDDNLERQMLVSDGEPLAEIQCANNKQEVTLKKVQCAVLMVRHCWRSDIARDIQLRITQNTDNPKNACFLFPVGTFDKHNQPRLNFVHFPVTPIRWHSHLPWGHVGEETVQAVPNGWEWRFLDRTPRPRWFGFVRFTLP